MARLLAACGGFLLAVLWMDLLFDVQATGLGRTPEGDAAILASIASYYRRVTIEAVPMNRLIGAVMIVTVLVSVLRVLRARRRRLVRVASALLAGGPVALALLRVFPNAMRLGSGDDPLVTQAMIAHTVLRDHLACLAAIAVFTALQLHWSATADD